MNLAAKIYERYGSKVYEVLRTNPYRLAEDINGIGFKIADEIAVVANGTIKAQGPAETIMGELLNGQDMQQRCSKQEEMFR